LFLTDVKHDDDDDLTGAFAHLIAPVVTSTSITCSFNKVQNGDILALASPGPSGK